jgi:LmbE family N-acetylglucosaminyl deacetylase
LGLRLMCVTAHPDDECFAFGGALAHAAERGVETYVLCFTEGQAATNRGNAGSGKELGKMRGAEFAASCETLGVKKYELLDHPDGKLESVEFTKLVRPLVERIRSFRPHVIITFGADGALNTHADHTMVSAVTSAAFHWAGHPKRYLDRGDLYQPQRLFYVSTDFFLPERHKPLPAPWTLTLDIRSVVEKKREACRKHASQAILEEQTRELFMKHSDNEYYALGAAIVPQPAVQSTDMFEGIAE